MHPNNTLAQYITNLPRRINLSVIWSMGSLRYTAHTIGTTFETPDWRWITTATWKRTRTSKTAIMTVPRRSSRRSTATNQYAWSYLTNRSCRKSSRTWRATQRSHCTAICPTYLDSGGWRRYHTHVAGSFDGCARLLHRRLEAWLRIAQRLFEPGRTPYRRRQDRPAAKDSADNSTTLGYDNCAFRSRPVHSDHASRIRHRRNR